MSAVAALFDRVARQYDGERRMLVPPFEDFYAAAVAAVGPLAPGARVVDLGAGTGLFAALLAAGTPGLRLTLVDASTSMLAEAQCRLAGAGAAGVETVMADLRDPLPVDRADVVISALAIHHLEHADQRALLRRVAEVLPPGGHFVNAEQVAQPTAAAEAAADRAWEAEARTLGASDAMIEAARARMAHDRCAPRADLLAWLEDAGFDAGCPWSGGRFAVLRGVRRRT